MYIKYLFHQAEHKSQREHMSIIVLMNIDYLND